jgi:hypothetical protein
MTLKAEFDELVIESAIDGLLPEEYQYCFERLFVLGRMMKLVNFQ